MKVSGIPSPLIISYPLVIKKEPSSVSGKEVLKNSEEREIFGKALWGHDKLDLVSFGYSCKLKTLFKKGIIKVPYSFYGGALSKRKVSIEHVIPRSKGGKSCQSNYVLCNKEQNWARGNDPICSFINWENVWRYLDQFRGVKVDGFDGDEYIKQILSAINEALQTGR